MGVGVGQGPGILLWEELCGNKMNMVYVLANPLYDVSPGPGGGGGGGPGAIGAISGGGGGAEVYTGGGPGGIGATGYM